MGTGDDVSWHARAAANILEARKKKGRLGSKKSRGGCITCKQRKVKCDELSPRCNQCTSSGRLCAGYVDHAARQSSRNSKNLVGRQLSQALGLTDNEKRSFDYFLSWAGPRLAGTLDRDFWCGKVLQLAQHEPLVLDSLMALSILYEHPQFMKSFLARGSSPGHSTASVYGAHPALSQSPINEHHAIALKYYNRAIRRFGEKMDRGTATPLLALLSCALFICVEIIRDNVFGGVRLFITGATLTRQFSTCPEGMDPSLYDAIRQMFARIAVLVTVFGHPAEHDVEEWAGNSPIDAGAFSTASDARATQFRLLAETHAWLRLTGYHLRDTISEGISNGVPAFANNAINESDWIDLPGPHPRPHELPGHGHQTHFGVICKDLHNLSDRSPTAPQDNSLDFEAMSRELYDVALERGDLSGEHRITMKLGDMMIPCDEEAIRERRDRLLRRLAKWHDSFRQLYPYENVEDEAAASMLLNYQVALIWIHAGRSRVQMAFDDCTLGYQEIIRLAELYIKRSKSPTFTFEVGAVPPLYFVAVKCRIPSLRRQALELLLKAPEKECMWGSRSAAEVAARLITIEEAGLGHPEPSLRAPLAGASHALTMDDTLLPPECQRMHNLGIVANRLTGRFDIRISRYFVDSQTDQKVKVLSDHPI